MNPGKQVYILRGVLYKCVQCQNGFHFTMVTNGWILKGGGVTTGRVCL